MIDRRLYVLGAAGIVAALIVFTAKTQSDITNSETGNSITTAGDDNSNLILDSVDKVTSIMNSWPSGSSQYQALIQSEADSNNIPALILAWLLWKESRYNPAIIDGSKRSPAGAMGIAQFMPGTANQILGSTAAALDPSQAIPGAARYLAGLYRQTGGWDLALAAYNWGIGNVTRKGLDAAPPETVDYYTTILNYAGVTV